MKRMKKEIIKAKWVADAMSNPDKYDDDDKLLNDMSKKPNEQTAPGSQQTGKR